MSNTIYTITTTISAAIRNAADDPADWYKAYGRHVPTEREGCVDIQTISYDDALSISSSTTTTERIAADIAHRHPRMSEDEIDSLMAGASEAAGASQSIADAIGTAADAAECGEWDVCASALEQAQRDEKQHGDSPSASAAIQAAYEALVLGIPDGVIDDPDAADMLDALRDAQWIASAADIYAEDASRPGYWSEGWDSRAAARACCSAGEEEGEARALLLDMGLAERRYGASRPHGCAGGVCSDIYVDLIDRRRAATEALAADAIMAGMS